MWRITYLALPALCFFADAALAGINEGLEAYRRGDYALVLMELRPLADQGDSAAQAVLGEMYLTAAACRRTISKRWSGCIRRPRKAMRSPKQTSESCTQVAGAVSLQG